VDTFTLSSESTLTDRYQTTIPETVRNALHLHKRDKLRYTIQADGNVLISRSDNEPNDPVLGAFLSFLAQDISANPSQLSALNTDLYDRIQDLVSDVDIDLDSQLSSEDE